MWGNFPYQLILSWSTLKLRSTTITLWNCSLCHARWELLLYHSHLIACTLCMSEMKIYMQSLRPGTENVKFIYVGTLSCCWKLISKIVEEGSQEAGEWNSNSFVGALCALLWHLPENYNNWKGANRRRKERKTIPKQQQNAIKCATRWKLRNCFVLYWPLFAVKRIFRGYLHRTHTEE